MYPGTHYSFNRLFYYEDITTTLVRLDFEIGLVNYCLVPHCVSNCR